MIKQQIHYSTPDRTDGKNMWQLVQKTTLDKNSVYKYIMFSSYFTDTCVVAKNDQELIGFITGFIPPDKPDTVFVWQIGVDPDFSGKGVGSSLLEQLITQVKDKDILFLEATITPSNQASRALFKKFAAKHDAQCQIESFLVSELFPDLDLYEEEELFRIGPLK